MILFGMAAYKSLCMKGDEYVVGIELPIIQVLSTSENPTDDVIEFPTDLKISTSMPRATEDSTSRMREIGEQLNFLLEKIMNWNYIRLKTWERSLGIVAECVQDIEEMQRLVESLGCLSLNGYEEKDGIPHRVYSILQMALSRVEEEFSHILCESRQPLEPENFSFCSKADAISFLDSIAALNSQLCEDTQVEAQRDNTRGLKEHIINLVHPNIIPILKCMAEVLFVSGYGAKCCQTYIGIRKDVLEECLLVLEVEKFRIEDVLQMDWRSLNSKIKKWIRAVKIFVTVYLASEKSLAHKIFGISGSVGQTCFIEASKGLILQLLSFGKAVATKNHAPENIVPILYMYEGLLGLLSNIQVLFLYEAGSAVSTDAHEILTGLGEAARRSLNDFKDVIRKNKSSSPFAGSGVHHLTMIVMSYLKTLTNHSDTLDILLKRGNPQEDNRDYHSPSSSIVNIAVTDDDSEWSSSHVSPIAWYLQSMISMLESNLENKSQLYTDVSLKHFFLMNNIFYMAQQVKESKLGPLLGENWIQEHNEKYQWHAENYESASWSPVLSFLRDEGIHIPQPGSFSKASLKVRFQCFKLAFEEIYGTQTAWFIPDAKLRQDLRISISLKLLQAFQMFLAMYFSQLPRKRHGDNYIKYCSKDLQGFLLDLFEGSPRSFAKSPSLKEEFSLILIENKRPLEPEHLPFQSSDEDLSSVDLNASADDEPSQSTKVRCQRNNTKGLEEYILDLVHPNVILDLKFLAEVMFASGHDAECCQAYISIRRDALEECLLVLEVEKHSIKDVLLMDWSSLSSKIRNWVQAAKIFVCICLPSEKSLAQKVFEVKSVAENCFIDASKGLILKFLRFGEAVAMRNHSPEKICSILHICDGLMGLLPNIDLLFLNESSSCVSTEAHEVLSGLGESVINTLNQFKIAVKTNELHAPFADGGVHHLTRYVMKYLKSLTNYSDTLNFLLEVGGEDSLSSSSIVNIVNDNERNSAHSVLPVARFLQCMMSALELNLESKSQVYKDVSQQHFFLMNNICYMVQKVKDSELEPLLGESWLRKQDGKFLQHSLNYERNSWSPVLSLLRHEGIWNRRSGAVSKAILKERILGFNLAFEEIYRTQRKWLIQNAQLRDHLRISISSKVFLAYTSFLERYSSQLPGRNIKYRAEDLLESLLDLFEGSPKPLHRSHRR